MHIFKRFYATVRPPITFKFKKTKERNVLHTDKNIYRQKRNLVERDASHMISNNNNDKTFVSRRKKYYDAKNSFKYNGIHVHDQIKNFDKKNSFLYDDAPMLSQKQNFYKDNDSQHDNTSIDNQEKDNFDKDSSHQLTDLSKNFVSLELFSVGGLEPRKMRIQELARYKNSRDSFVAKSKNARGPDISINNEIVYGIYPVLLALQTQKRSFFNLYFKDNSLQKNNKLQEIYNLCQSYNVPTHSVTKNEFIRLVGSEKVHQGVCLEASKLPFLIFENLSEEEKKDIQIENGEKFKLWLYLDQINDPMNLGAIIRTAYYLGVDKVFTSQTDSCPISNVVSKASSGAAEILPIYQILEIDKVMRILKEKDWHIISSVTHSNKTISVDEFQSSKNIFLIVGNEGRGVSSVIEEYSDVLLTIPPNERCLAAIQSLNVSVATSILLHSLLTKLNIK